MSMIGIMRAGPLTTIQDDGRPGMLGYGISASGPMDRAGYAQAGSMAGAHAGAAIEFSSAGLCVTYGGASCRAGMAGGRFTATLNGHKLDWPCGVALQDGDVLDIHTGPTGNFGYLRFDREIDVPIVLKSRSTNATVGLGGLEGRVLRAGDRLKLEPEETVVATEARGVANSSAPDAPLRVIWGIHAQEFSAAVRSAFCDATFSATSQMNRMGMRLADTSGVFADAKILSLVSDAIVPGDIQILGDGSPIVLLRDHQPTGGYPRIATIIDADLDRFAQMRPGTKLRFLPVTVESAHNRVAK